MKRFFVFVTVLISVFTACTPDNGIEDNGASALNNDGTFEISIYTDKKEYKAEQEIICRAVVEYVGEGEGTVIYSGDPLVGFALKDDKYFDGTYCSNLVLMETEFNKAEPVTVEFSKSGGWSGEDPNAEFYKEFYSEKELILPPGEYEISATIDGFFDKDDYQSSEYELKVSVRIIVK